MRSPDFIVSLFVYIHVNMGKRKNFNPKDSEILNIGQRVA